MENSSPLYLLAQNNELPEYQFMDVPTLEWIKKNGPKFDDVQTVKIDPKVIIGKYLERYAPKKVWFKNKLLLSTLHGERHILRCIALAGIFCEAGFFTTNVNELCILASLHDIRRKNDNSDDGHSERAALWLKKNKEIVSEAYKYQIDKSFVEKMSEAILSHDKNEYLDMSDIPSINLVDSFKMIDALDRYRQPKIKWWMNESYLKVTPNSFMKKISFDLVVGSEGYALLGFDNVQSVYKTIHDIL